VQSLKSQRVLAGQSIVRAKAFFKVNLLDEKENGRGRQNKDHAGGRSVVWTEVGRIAAALSNNHRIDTTGKRVADTG